MTKKLYRNEDEAVFAGVCSGLAEYFDLDVTLVRVIFVLLVIGGGSGILIYLILWVVTPFKKNGAIIETKDDVKDLVDDLGKKTKNMAKEIRKDIKTSPRKSGGMLGVILMALGVMILLEKIMPMVIRWDYVWPGILIFVGAYLVFRD